MAALAGCNDLGLGPFQGGGSQASATAALVAATPRVEITLPARGAFLAVGPIAVEGHATSAPGSLVPVQAVRVNGQAVPLAPDGTFRALIQAVAGTNIIDASATDAEGRLGSTSVGVLAGSWATLGQPVPDAVGLRLNASGLDGLSKVVDGFLWTLDLGALLKDPIVDETFLGFIHTRVVLRNPRFRDVHSRLFSRPDGLWVEAVLQAPYLEAEASATLLAQPETVQATATMARVTGRFVLEVLPDRRLGVRLADPDVRFDRFQATFRTSLLTLISRLLQTRIEQELEALLENELLLLGPQIQPLLDEALVPQVPLDMYGTPFLLDARAESTAFATDGFEVHLSFDAPLARALTPRGALAPGSYSTRGPAPALSHARGLAVALDDDAVNRALHVAWATGALDIDFSSLLLQQTGISFSPGAPPTGGVTAADLAQVLPEIRGALPPTAALGARLEAGLPPVLKVSGSPDLVRLEIAELYVDVLVDRGQGMERLFRVALHAAMGASVALDPQTGGIRLSSARNAEIALDLLDAPIVPIDKRRLQIVLSTLLTPLLPRLINDLTLVPIPFVHQLSFAQLQASAGGPDAEHLFIQVDLVR